MAVPVLIVALANIGRLAPAVMPKPFAPVKLLDALSVGMPAANKVV